MGIPLSVLVQITRCHFRACQFNLNFLRFAFGLDFYRCTQSARRWEHHLLSKVAVRRVLSGSNGSFVFCPLVTGPPVLTAFSTFGTMIHHSLIPNRIGTLAQGIGMQYWQCVARDSDQSSILSWRLIFLLFYSGCPPD